MATHDLIGLDLGRNLGVAEKKGDSIRTYTRELPANVGQYMSDSMGIIRAFYRESPQRQIAFEQPFASSRPSRDALNTAARNFGFVAALMMVARENRAPTPLGYLPGNARKNVIGWGNATEKQIYECARKLGADPANDHEADAVIIYERARQDIGDLL